jgi:predicted DNA-binding transcriptional regulator YafY
MSLQDDYRRRIARLFIIANRLEQGGPVTRAELADDCGCSLRTISRDLAFLKEAEVKLAYDPRQHTYTLEAPLPFQTVQFGLSEVMALAVAQEAVLGQSGLPFEASVRAAFNRVISRIPPKFREALLATREVVSFGPDMRRDYAAAPWNELLEAANSCETVEMHYHNLARGEWTIRRVDPYHIIERRGYLTLVGYCHINQEVRDFALDRIRAPRLIGQTFTVKEGFSLETYMSGSVGVLRGEPTRIVVRFDAAMAPYARRRHWEFPHEMEDLPDGGLLLRGTVSGTEGIRTELLSWGAGVEVLEPASLRERMRQIGQSIASKHEA